MTDRRILIVAHRTAASPKLLAAVAERAARGPCRFTLLVPRPYWDPDTEEAAITLELAIPLLDAAAGSHVQGIVGATDPYEAVRQTLEREKYDEVIVSTLPERVSRWLHLDLAAGTRHGGLAHIATEITGFGVRYTLDLLRRGWPAAAVAQ